MTQAFHVDPVTSALYLFLGRIEAGESAHGNESMHVDAKQLPELDLGRGLVRAAADFLWPHLACMANTPHGGAIVLGVLDRGDRQHLDLPTEAVARRIWEISGGDVTPQVITHTFGDDTVATIWLVGAARKLQVPPTGPPRWRVADSCVEVTPEDWHRAHRLVGTDWSALASGRRPEEIDGAALAAMRGFMRDAGGDRAGRAALSDDELLRTTPFLLDHTDNTRLTNAGALLLTAQPAALDAIFRSADGAGVSQRVSSPGPLLVQVREVFDAMRSRRRSVDIAIGAVQRTIPEVPDFTARESTVNGLVHRDWEVADPTVVEWSEAVVRVTSPGGLPHGVSEESLLVGTSRPRYPALAELMRSVGLVDRAGNGVRRMTVEALQLGRPAPTIRDVGGRVRCEIGVGQHDEAWIRYCAEQDPPITGLNTLLVLRTALRLGFVTPDLVARETHTTSDAAGAAIRALSGVVLRDIDGQPPGVVLAKTLGDEARRALPQAEIPYLPENREILFRLYAEEAGRISSTEGASLLGLSSRHAARAVLKDSPGFVASNRAGMGHGNHYVLADSDVEDTDDHRSKRASP